MRGRTFRDSHPVVRPGSLVPMGYWLIVAADPVKGWTPAEIRTNARQRPDLFRPWPAKVARMVTP